MGKIMALDVEKINLELRTKTPQEIIVWGHQLGKKASSDDEF